jgi:hypothetical protein
MNRRLPDRDPVILRAYIGVNSVVAWYNATIGAGSVLGETARRIDGGTAFVWAMGLMGLCVVLDAVINDVMPERFKWLLALRKRHFFLFALGACHMALPFMSSSTSSTYPLVYYCLSQVFFIGLASMSDAKRRQRDFGCAILRN